MDSLQSAFHINRLLDILEDSLKKLRDPVGIMNAGTATDPNLAKASHCFVHQKKEIELYCETCEELICLRCIMKGGKHHTHNYEDINQAFEKYEGEMTSLLEPMEKQVTVITKALAQLNKDRDDISSQQAAIEENIQVTFKQLREILSARETELIGQLQQTTQDKLNGLGIHVDNIEKKLAQLTSCLSFVRESLKTGNKEDVLLMKMNTARQAKELIIPLCPDILNSNIKADTAFEVTAALIEECRNYGKMVSPGVEDIPSPDPTTGKSAPEASGHGKITDVGSSRSVDKNEISVQPGRYENVTMSRGKRYALQPVKSSLKYVLVPQDTSARASDERGEKEVASVQPIAKERHNVYANREDGTGTALVPAAKEKRSVYANRDDATGTPPVPVPKEKHSVYANRDDATGTPPVPVPKEKHSVYANRDDATGTPPVPVPKEKHSVYANRDDTTGTPPVPKEKHSVYANREDVKGTPPVPVPKEKHNVYANREDATGTPPVPIAKDKHNVYANREDVKGTPPIPAARLSTGKKVKMPMLAFSGVGGAQGVAINHKGEVVVTDRDRHSVSVFTPSGTTIRSFGTAGSSKGELRHPRGIVIDPEGNLLVADSSNHRIQKFTSEGRFLTSVGTKGKEPLQFSSPSDLVFNNSVYVIDCGNHRIQILKPDLSFSGSFGKEGREKGQFSHPRGIACDSAGKVYVADRDNHRIQVFTAEGEFLMMFGKRGQGRGELDMPICIAVNTNQLIIVSEGGNHRISVFTSEGQFVRLFGRQGEKPREFNFPCGLAVDTSGVVYVCDYRNSRVQMLKQQHFC